MSEYHTPVLLKESLDALINNPSGLYVDATFGGGGHSAGTLSRLSGNGRLLAFDRDADAIKNRMDDPRLCLARADFRFVENFLKELAHEEGHPETWQADGILADLGVSSHQFDTAERGFSFRFDAELDMRMNDKADTTAADIINTYSKEDLERVFRIYGEVDNAGKAAALLLKAREIAPIRTTGDLSKALAPVLPPYAEHKYLAKVYQGLRIEVNHEMRSLEKFLEGAARSLKPGGRLVVITYHSLEDRMVKNFIKSGNADGKVSKDIFGNKLTPLSAVNRKPILPSEEEIAGNTRARSAKLRIAVKEDRA